MTTPVITHHSVVITLEAAADIGIMVTAVPVIGRLYQFTSKGPGKAIKAKTMVEDSRNRLYYVYPASYKGGCDLNFVTVGR